MTFQYIQFALSPEDITNTEIKLEQVALANFYGKVRKSRSNYQAFIGRDGQNDVDLSRGERRQIMGALRKSTAILGMGQKSRIGKLGGGAAIGAVIAGFAMPAMAQSVSGGNNNGQASSLAVGTGATTAVVSGSSVAVGNNASVTNFSDSIAIGASASAPGGREVAVGTRALAQNNKGIAIGTDAQVLNASAGAIGEAGSIAIGDTSLARANGTDPFNASAATVVGNNGQAIADGAVAFGEVAIASSYYASAIGSYSTASGLGAVAVGGGSMATASGGIAIGGATSTGSATGLSGFASSTGVNAIAVGTSSVANASGAVAIGANATASTSNVGTLSGGIAIGNTANAGAVTGGSSIAIGISSSAAPTSGIGDSIALGSQATSTGTDAIALGGQAVASGANAINIGGASTVSGQNSVRVGGNGGVTGNNAIALGTNVIVGGNGSTAIGTRLTVAGTETFAAVGSTAAGGSSVSANNAVVINPRIADVTYSAAGVVAIGHGVQASGTNGIAIGIGANSSGIVANAIGSGAAASGLSANALGTGAAAAGANGVAIGSSAASNTGSSVALGNSARAGDVGGTTSFETALGANSIAVGGGASALGHASNAAALGATALGSESSVTAQDATAVGFQTVASGVNATAIGNQLTVSGAQSFGVMSPGGASTVSGSDSVVINPEVSTRTYAAAGVTAVGSGALASGIGSTSIGRSANASADNATALGASSLANAISATALGQASTASNNFATAVGFSSTASGTSSFAGGRTAQASGASSVSIGHDVVAQAADTVAIGHSSTAVGPGSVSIGLGQTSTGRGSVAIGDPNTANGTGAVVLGADSVAAGNAAGTTAANGAVAIGNANQAIGQGSVAIGNSNDALGAGSVAIGDNATANNARDVALGSGSVSAAPNTGDFTINGGAVAGAASNGVVSVGSLGNERQIQNVAAGVVSASSTDAINGSQLYLTELATNNLGDSIETITGGGLVLNADGTIATNPSITAAGSTHSTVTGAIQALDTANTTTNNGLATALGGGAAVAANGAVTAPSYTVGGTTYTDVGSALGALDTGALVKQTGGSPGSGQITVGAATGGTSVSMAGTSGDRIVTGVAAGSTTATSVDAVNGGQINALAASIAANTGGGSSYNPVTGTVSTPTVNVGGTAYSNLASAIEAAGAGFNLTTAATGTGTATGTSVEGIAAGETVTMTAGDNIKVTQTANNVAVALNPALTGLTSVAITGGPTISSTGITGLSAGAVSATSTDAVNGSQLFATNQAITNINNGTTGLVQQSPAAPSGGPITVGATTGGTVVNFANSSGVNRTLTGVAAGSTAATSVDAVNGGQLNTAMTSVATDLGGGASYNPVTGVVTAPGYAIDGTTYNNVGDALAALAADSKYVDFNSALAAANASGNNASAIGPNAQASGNNSTAIGVNSDASGTNATALGSQASASGNNATALGNGAAATGTNSVALGSGSQAGTNNAGWTGTTFAGQTMTNAVNANAVVSISGGTTNRQLTGVADGAVNATSTDAVNGAQLFNAATALNTMSTNIGSGLVSSLGGGASVAPNGTVTNPTYTVAGGTQNNVGAALGALNTANNIANAGLAAAVGGGASVAPNGTVTAPSVKVNGTTYSNLTDAVQAAGAGFNLTTSATGTGVAHGTSVASVGAGETQTLTAGNNVITTQSGNEVQVALNSDLTGIDSITLNNGSITGLATGSTAAGSTDAVNGSQINIGLSSVATNLGGGSTYDPLTGTVTTVDYTVQGTTYHSVGTALGAVDSNLNNILNGTAGLVQQAGGSPSAGQITIGAATGGTSVSFAGTIGNRVLTDVAAGTITATSDDAVNGAQIYANNQSVAGLLGGGAGVDPLTGALTAPVYNVGGSTYGNVGAALAALQSGAPVQYSTSGAPTTPNGLVPSQNMTLVGAAAGPVSLSNVGPASLTPTSTDAVNGSQVNTLANSLATVIGSSSFDPVTGAVTSPGFAVQGTTYGNVAAALGAVNSNLNIVNAAVTGGAGIKYFHANSTQTDSAPVGMDSVAIGPVAGAGGDRSVSIGLNSNAGGIQSIAIGTGNNVTGNNSGAIGDPNVVTGNASYALGNNNTINANNAFVVGNGVTIAAGNDGSVALGNASTVAAPNAGAKSINGGTIAAMAPTAVVSVGSAGGERQVTNVAAGVVSATSTDAINGSQLYAVGAALNKQGSGIAAALGGGASVAPDGTVTSPNYTVGGTTVNNVGAALTVLDGQVAGLANGTSGLVQQAGGAPGSGQITVGAGTGGTTVSVAGTAGNRNLTGVAAGSLAPASTDAVNGSQVNALASSTAAALGGGSTFNPATSQISQPSYAVGGVNYGSMGSALAASDALAVQYVPDASGAPTNAVRLGAPGNSGTVGMTNLAPGAVTASSTDAVNGSQLFSVQTLASGGLQRSGGTMSGNIAMGGNRVTGIGAPVDMSDAATKGYVDGIQAQNVDKFNLMTAGLNSAFRGIEKNSQGVALSMAMGGGFLSDDKDFSLWGAWGNFNGYNALAAQTYIRLSDDAYLNAGVSFGMEEKLVGTRVGFGIQF